MEAASWHASEVVRVFEYGIRKRRESVGSAGPIAGKPAPTRAA
jgi:hypothetical protein